MEKDQDCWIYLSLNETNKQTQREEE